MPMPGRAGGQEPAPAADEQAGLPAGPAPWGFESVSRGFNSGSGGGTRLRVCRCPGWQLAFLQVKGIRPQYDAP
jgi:hypothetical protein